MSDFISTASGAASDERHDPLWQLLGQNPLPQPDAWFTVRTVARCRYEALAADSRHLFVSRVWRWVLGSGLGVGLALLVVAHVQAPVSPATNEQKVQEAFAILASMGDDSDGSSSAPSPSPSPSPSWQDSSL